jgi:hypothetical protein
MEVSLVIARTLALCLACAAILPAQVPVVVELFTSEGCSSCPPADDILYRLDNPVSGRGGKQRPAASNPNVQVIALGEHVDYWDSDGWKDRFSSPLFSARQQDYGVAFRVRSVYTPRSW